MTIKEACVCSTLWCIIKQGRGGAINNAAN